MIDARMSYDTWAAIEAILSNTNNEKLLDGITLYDAGKDTRYD